MCSWVCPDMYNNGDTCEKIIRKGPINWQKPIFLIRRDNIGIIRLYVLEIVPADYRKHIYECICAIDSLKRL